jgi:hypothetical protein
MRMQAPVLFLTALFGAQAPADVYRVRNTNDSGTYSLRWAINQANKHVGRDKIVFAARLAGRVIRPQTPLPDIEDARTIIDGDIDGDGAPDIALNGRDLDTGPGLALLDTSYCRISGLAIVSFPWYGISLREADHSTIDSCHIGVNLAGTKWVPNGSSSIHLDLSCHNLIGGSSPADRNVIGAGRGSGSFGVAIFNGSTENTVAGNYFGVTRDGMTAFGGGSGGIRGLSRSNTFTGNVFGGVDRCVDLGCSHANVISGNYFGLAADGDALLPISIGVVLAGGSTDNTIGGTTSEARNVFAGNADSGVLFTDTGTESNRVQGNYFGLNAAGTQQRRIGQCVVMTEDSGPAGRQIIGGGTPRAGNYFTPKGPSFTTGVATGLGCGHNSVIRHNTFGVLPNGTSATVMYVGVGLCGIGALVTDNTFARAGRAIWVYQDGADPRIFRNTFRACSTAVEIDIDARCRLGNLGNSSTADDGGNVFRRSNVSYICNLTANRIKAEGNRFGTTSRAAIDAKIWDRRDDNTLGRVDFNPLAGGVIPSGETVPLTVASATALPTGSGGAEIAFSLSAPASVTVGVFNIAGRPVAALVRGTPADAGRQRVMWSGRGHTGTQVPNGTYLVRVLARDDDGQQAQALCTLRLRK